MSGLVLVVVGLRVVRPIEQASRDAGTLRRQNRPLLVLAAAGVGVFTGLLANGGGFLLVPLYLLVFGLRMRQAVGTSLIVIMFLAIPTLVTHWALGHIDWAISGQLALGLVPRASLRADTRTMSRARCCGGDSACSSLCSASDTRSTDWSPPRSDPHTVTS